MGDNSLRAEGVIISNLHRCHIRVIKHTIPSRGVWINGEERKWGRNWIEINILLSTWCKLLSLRIHREIINSVPLNLPKRLGSLLGSGHYVTRHLRYFLPMNPVVILGRCLGRDTWKILNDKIASVSQDLCRHFLCYIANFKKRITCAPDLAMSQKSRTKKRRLFLKVEERACEQDDPQGAQQWSRLGRKCHCGKMLEALKIQRRRWLNKFSWRIDPC